MIKRKNMIFLAGMFIITMVFTGCGNASKNGKEIFETSEMVPTKGADNPVDSLEVSKEPIQSPDIVIAKIKEGQAARLGEDVSYEGCILNIQNIEVTKAIGSRDKAQFNYWGEETDEVGNLTGGQSYIFVSLTCRNDTKQSKELFLNSNGFVYTDDEGILNEGMAEARFLDKPQKNNQSSDKHFQYSLKSGEKTEQIELGYIVEDDILNRAKEFYYCIGYRGSSIDSADNRYVEVVRGGK